MSVTIEMLGSAPGSYMPETQWLLYAENVPAPLCRKPGGSYMAEDDSLRSFYPRAIVERECLLTKGLLSTDLTQRAPAPSAKKADPRST
jgi:hypothetical protein